MRRLSKLALPILITVSISALYLWTVAPGLTWAYDGADGGDLLAAVATSGVPHPGGYPTYIFLASLFTKLPFGSLAYRANVFSSICMALAVLVLYRLTFLLTGKKLAASIAAFLFGTFQLVWSQALITEVYALQTLLSLLVLLFFLPRKPTTVRDIAGGLTLGLALGNHLTAIFLLPFMFLNASHQPVTIDSDSEVQVKRHLKRILNRLAGLCVGLSVYLIIPFRARTQAPVNWGNAVDWNGFWWLVSGVMYRGRLVHLSPEYLLTAVRLWSGFLLDQIGIIGLSVGLITFIVTFKANRLYLTTGWLFLVYSLFAILYYSPDSYVYLIPVLMSFAIWIGLGIAFVIEKVPPKLIMLKPVLILMSFAVIGVRAFMMIPEMDLSEDHAAEQYALTVLSSLPKDAIVVTRGDEALFSLWYFHYAIGQRPDLVVASGDLLVQPWYHDVLKSTYPTLNISDSPWPQDLAALNPERPFCSLSADLQPQFECLP